MTRDYARNMVASGRTTQLLKELFDQGLLDSESRGYSARWNALSREKLTGVISNSDASLTANQINDALLYWIDKTDNLTDTMEKNVIKNSTTITGGNFTLGDGHGPSIQQTAIIHNTIHQHGKTELTEWGMDSQLWEQYKTDGGPKQFLWVMQHFFDEFYDKAKYLELEMSWDNFGGGAILSPGQWKQRNQPFVDYIENTLWPAAKDKIAEEKKKRDAKIERFMTGINSVVLDIPKYELHQWFELEERIEGLRNTAGIGIKMIGLPDLTEALANIRAEVMWEESIKASRRALEKHKALTPEAMLADAVLEFSVETYVEAMKKIAKGYVACISEATKSL